eukprot:TRINITY_DN255_c0_g1_i2.p2 TRINITY_DN255_c0_g1~~TRINITY_DN255_c0_g1_i2.p2  ORF type:complete len:163 (-),score=28.28 TRINITY_DN255_c0_g1_i2:109-597(-)
MKYSNTQRPVLACQVLSSRTPSALNLHSALLLTQDSVTRFSLQSRQSELCTSPCEESLGTIECSSCIRSNDLNMVRNLKGICRYRPQAKVALQLPKRRFVSAKVVKPLISIPDELKKTLVTIQKKKIKKRRVSKKRVRQNLLLDSLTNSVSTESSLGRTTPA